MPMIFAFGFFSMFLVIIPVVVPLFLDLGINMQEFLILQAHFGIVVAIFEVPSGYLSDIWGRKKTLIFGASLNLLAMCYLYFANGLFDLFVYQTFVAIAFSMISGADLAFLYDNDGTSAGGSSTVQKTNLMANYNSTKLLGETTAAILGGILAVYSFKFVIVGQIIADFFLLAFACLLTEKPFQKMAKNDHLKNLKEAFQYLIKDKDLLIIFTNVTVWSLASFSAIWLFQKQWQEDNIDIKYFGYIWASYMLVSALFSKIAIPIKNKIGTKLSLLALCVFPLIGYIGMINFSSFSAAMFGYFFAIGRSFNFVFLKTEMNHRIQSKYRATMNSIQSLAFRLSFFVIGPILGYIVNKYSIKMGYISLLALFSACFFLFMTSLFKYKNWSSEQKV